MDRTAAGVASCASPFDSSFRLPPALGAGEREAITLAEEIHAEVLLIDDWAGRREAERRSLAILGTLGLLSLAAQKGLIDLSTAIARLRQTNFRVTDKLIRSVLDQDTRPAQ